MFLLQLIHVQSGYIALLDTFFDQNISRLVLRADSENQACFFLTHQGFALQSMSVLRMGLIFIKNFMCLAKSVNNFLAFK